MATPLKDFLAQLQKTEKAALEAIKQDRSLSDEGKDAKRRAVRLQTLAAYQDATQRELQAKATRKKETESAYREAKRAYRQSFDVARASYALERSRLLAEHGDWPAVETAIAQACSDGDRYAVAAWRDLHGLVLNRFRHDKTVAFAVIGVARDLTLAEEALQPPDLVAVRERMEDAQVEAAEVLDVFGNILFEANFMGDTELRTALQSAIQPDTTPVQVIGDDGRLLAIQTQPGQAWL